MGLLMDELREGFGGGFQIRKIGWIFEVVSRCLRRCGEESLPWHEREMTCGALDQGLRV